MITQFGSRVTNCPKVSYYKEWFAPVNPASVNSKMKPYFFTIWPKIHKRILYFLHLLLHIAHTDHVLCTG